jgi:hypothetical protein
MTRPPRTPEEQRKRNAAKARAWRERQKREEAEFRFILPKYAIAEALILSGRLSETAALDDNNVRTEMKKVCLDFIERWMSDRNR